jgi:hypothetical protein
MKKLSSPPNAVSRRTFAKSIAAGIVAARVACATPPAQAQTSAPSADPCSCPALGDMPVKCQNIITGLEIEPHEPPVILTNGSLRFEMGRQLSSPTPITGNPARHFRYKLTEQSYANIHRLQVLTERERLIETFYYYPNRLCHLRLWLQKSTGAGWEPLTTEPQILISFTINAQGIPEFSLETDMRLNTRANSFKPSRPNRYEHPGLGGTAHFRLAKWRLADPVTGNVISTGFEDDLTPANSGINGFQLAVLFEDLPRLLELRRKK